MCGCCEPLPTQRKGETVKTEEVKPEELQQPKKEPVAVR